MNKGTEILKIYNKCIQKITLNILKKYLIGLYNYTTINKNNIFEIIDRFAIDVMEINLNE